MFTRFSARRISFLTFLVFALYFFIHISLPPASPSLHWTPSYDQQSRKTLQYAPVTAENEPEANERIKNPLYSQHIAQFSLADPAATHIYHRNGLVQVNPDGTHPILELIRNGERKWKEKLAKASKTLSQAVAEYKRRYGRPPPKGFDDWWNYAQENNVQLPDEYDFINSDLEPFWGISPTDLQIIQFAQEFVTDTFTLSKPNSSFPTELVRTSFSTPETWKERSLLRGLHEIQNLLEPVEEMLPPFRIIISPHDNPNLLSDFHVKKVILEAARSGKYVDIDELPKPANLGYVSACEPGSPARPEEISINQNNRPSPRQKPKTFINDHRLSMDPCQNPHIFYNHGQYLQPEPGPSPSQTLALQFSYCSTPIYHDIQPPGFIAWHDEILPRENDPEWERKSDERIFWRGGNTGIHHNEFTRWRFAQRAHLVRLMTELNGTENVLMAEPPGRHHHHHENGALGSGSGWDWDKARVGEGVEIKKNILNPNSADVYFSGKAIACDKSYCDYLESVFEYRRPVDRQSGEVGRHKYLIDVDGNGWSSRFKRLMTSNSLVFKASAYHEWWIDRIQPWVHYVPIQIDYSDLYDSYTFFRGGLYGEGNHDELAKKIGKEGRRWSKQFWRREDMTAYMFRLLLEYARITSLDRDSMNYVEDE